MVGLAFSLQWVVSGMFGTPAGWLGDRYGVRVTMVIGACLFILGMVLTATVTNIWQFYFYFGIILSAAMGIFQVPLTAGVTQWFHRQLGVGMGVLQASQGLGPLVAVPIILFIIAVFSGEPGLLVSWIPGIGAFFGSEEKGLRGVVLDSRNPGRCIAAGTDSPVPQRASVYRRPAVGHVGRGTGQAVAVRSRRQSQVQGVSEAGVAHDGLLEPDRDTLLGLRPATPLSWCTSWPWPRRRECPRGWPRGRL